MFSLIGFPSASASAIFFAAFGFSVIINSYINLKKTSTPLKRFGMRANYIYKKVIV